jgi:predicted PurR-regulated permease PerM
MWDMFAVIFIFFVLALYAGITLVFVIAGIRNWIWRPIAKRISRRRSESNYGGVKSTRHEESAS